ncbi:Na(+)/H(+) antiporter subunit C [Streptomyces sp. ME03-5684b]|uniref:Na(+)/H(+) antiporter subunit C n=1 Tax=Streptomyces sp. ME03-5684b TaxID=3028681 RepID=UPI0029A7E253|nr:Na(+)/H(+) antiporter subunit C [Streptomyces sp. ME03-5684b]MDX3316017.1 Na(+)/H(+) antiporter subunit C [Streptomyces sp. ME03-5684b]
MTVSLSLLVAAAVLNAVGATLLLTRSLTRILLGAVVLGNGVNLLVLAATGSAGEAPLLYPHIIRNRVTDPLPQAIALTAIVITLATTAFLLAMAYRSHQVTGSDEISDDTEDRLVALRAEFLDRRGELRDRYREARAGDGGADAEQRARYRAARRRLRRRVREERAYQARANDVSGNLWNDILGADPEDYREGRELGSTDAAGRPAPAPARVAGPSNDPEETGREPDSLPGEDSCHPPPDRPDDPGGAGTEGTG